MLNEGTPQVVKCAVLLFLSLLSPVVLQAASIQLVGSGYFSCFANPPKPGFAVNVYGSFAGRDNQGNYVSVVVNHGQLGGEDTCDSSLPTVGSSSNFCCRNFSLDGQLSYLNQDYTFHSQTNPGQPGCATSSPDISCTVTFSMSPSLVKIQFVAWEHTGTIADLDLGGAPNASVNVGQEEVCFIGGCWTSPI